MNNITQSSLNDEEIKTATARLQELVINNADPADIAMAQTNLRDLIASRQSYRFTPKDPSYFFNKLFSYGLREDRHEIAGELEESIINVFIDLQKQPQGIQDSELFNSDLLLDLLEFVRFFRTPPTQREDDQAEPDDATVGQLLWGNKDGLTIPGFCDGLIQQKFITPANARLLALILEGGVKHPPKLPVKINWEGTKNSITTFFVVSQFLGILNPTNAPTRRRVLIEDYMEPVRLAVPPAPQIIADNFTINGEKPDLSNISTYHVRPIILELDRIKDAIEGLYVSRRMGPRTADNLTWDDILTNFFKLYNDPVISRDDLLPGVEHTDIDVLSFLNDMVSNAIKDRNEVAFRLSTSS
jgi:hypothetical protein